MQTIEGAWRAGFDERSARQYGRRLVGKHGRAAWIGAPEVYALLCHLYVSAFLVEVVASKHDEAGAAVHAVCVTWFARGVTAAERSSHAPLYLQRHGHSVSLVGALRSPPRLLIRDPKDAAAPNRLRCVSPAELDGCSWQIVGVRGKPLQEDEARAQRCKEPAAAAQWLHGRWEYAEWFELRF